MIFASLQLSLRQKKIGFPQYTQSAPAVTNGPRPKRKQVKMAVSRSLRSCILHFNPICSVLIVPTLASVATKRVRVSAASSMGFKLPASMASARSARRASSVARTSARARMTTPAQKRLLLVSTSDCYQ